MVLLALSASHHDLDLDVLEQLSSGARSVGPTAVADSCLDGCVVLATCNRFELYLDAVDGREDVAAKAAVDAVAEATGLPADDVAHALRPRTGMFPVAQHLFGVASGLDSMVVGEREVAGQVRRALASAREDGTTSSDLERLFQWASRASRAVGAGTSLGSSGRSVVAVALDLAGDALAAPPAPEALPGAAASSGVAGAAPDDALAGRRALVVGTGTYARAVLSALERRGVHDVAIYSPSGRAAELAAARGLTAVPDGGLLDAVAAADVVVTCSGTLGPVLGPDDVRAARPDGRPVAIVDLALRHDVDPAVAGVPGVTFVDLGTVQQHAGYVAPEVADGWQIVAEHAARFADTLSDRDVVPAVVALRAYVHEVLDDELRRGRVSAPETERALRRFAGRLLHTSAVQARAHARRGTGAAYREAVETLLGVELDDDGSPQGDQQR